MMTRSFVLLMLAVASMAAAEDAPARYAGRIAASQTAVLSTQLNGVIAEILFRGGEQVAQGQPLIRLDPFDAETARAVATARRDAAAARLGGAAREAGRAEALSARGVASEARRGQSETERAAAAAALAEAEADLRQAERDVERTVIVAPISGRISRPMTEVGAFVEAEAGPPLARIVALQPTLVGYDVPYAERLARLREAGVDTVEALLARIEVRIELPGGALYPETARPSFADAEIDTERGTVTVWAEVDNPDALLRPGLAVTVLSQIAGDAP